MISSTRVGSTFCGNTPKIARNSLATAAALYPAPSSRLLAKVVAIAANGSSDAASRPAEPNASMNADTASTFPVGISAFDAADAAALTRDRPDARGLPDFFRRKPLVEIDASISNRRSQFQVSRTFTAPTHVLKAFLAKGGVFRGGILIINFFHSGFLQIQPLVAGFSPVPHSMPEPATIQIYGPYV